MLKTISKILLTVIFIISNTNINSQEKTSSLIEYAPNSNFIVLKAKNAKELKVKLESHPLKKLLCNSKTIEVIDEAFNLFNKEDTDIQIKEIEKKIFEKLFTSFNGEVILTISYLKAEEGKYDPNPRLVYSLIAQVDQIPFLDFIKQGVKYADKAASQKTISNRQHENFEYYSLDAEDDPSSCAFAAVVDGLGVLSNDEELFKKISTAIIKKTPFEKGLKSNEKVIAYLNANQNKDFLFMKDLTPIFKNIVSDEKSIYKIPFEAMKVDKLFQINGAITFDEKTDSLDFTLNCLDDSCIPFTAFINSEFTPSPFIGSDIRIYLRTFFSISLLKTKFIEMATKADPKFLETTYKSFNEIYGIDAFINSIGEDFEGFSIMNKDNAEEIVCVNKAKNPSLFLSNFGNIINKPIIKEVIKSNFIVSEKKEEGNQFWLFSSQGKDPNVTEDRFTIGMTEPYAFFSMPGNLAQKHISQIKKGPAAMLSGLDTYNNTRALFPTKVAYFLYSNVKDIISSLKLKITDQQANLASLTPKMDKILSLIDEINAEDFKGNLSFGLWKDTNQISVSIKLNNK
jgi:hypothetical protein